MFVAVIEQGDITFRSNEVESTGDACEAIVDLLGLTEKQFQSLWDNMMITLNNNIVASVEEKE